MTRIEPLVTIDRRSSAWVMRVNTHPPRKPARAIAPLIRVWDSIGALSVSGGNCFEGLR